MCFGVAGLQAARPPVPRLAWLTVSERPIVVLGAGATKASGGPLTAEILPRAFTLQEVLQREDFYPILERFLVENFHLPSDANARGPEHFPPLPLLISLIDTAIDRKDNWGPQWPADRVEEVRDALQYVMFALLEHDLRNIAANPTGDLFRELFHGSNAPPTVISLNYDIIADNSLISLGGDFPDYGCDIATDMYRQRVSADSRLYKLHGSLNWLHCPACHRLDVGMSESGRYMTKTLDALYSEEQQAGLDLHSRYTCHGSPCLTCGTYVRPVMITPTHMKDYRNPHVSRVWFLADQALRSADRAIIVGYSLPDDDVDVIYLLKRGLAHLPPDQITVVDYDPTGSPDPRSNRVGARYATVFGEGIRWHPEGLDAYLQGGHV